MEKTKTIIICILFIIIVLLRTCSNLNPNCKEPKLVHDTVRLETHDTIWPKQSKIALEPKNLTPVASYTINGTLPSFDSICSLKRIYRDSIKDSNLIFFYEIETIGLLNKFEPSYKLFIPLQITHTINNTVTLTESPRVGVYGGLILGGNKEQFNMAPYINITDKKDNSYHINYSLTQKTINIGFAVKLNKKHK